MQNFKSFEILFLEYDRVNAIVPEDLAGRFAEDFRGAHLGTKAAACTYTGLRGGTEMMVPQLRQLCGSYAERF